MTQQSNWDDWNRWCDARIVRALAKRDRFHIEAVGQALAVIRQQLRDEIQEAVGELRAEMNVQRAHESGRVVDLPRIPLRRRSDAA